MPIVSGMPSFLMESSKSAANLHHAEILDQFTRQAEPFARRHAGRDTDLLALMACCANVGPQDAVLDIACGPGIVSCFFARRAREVTGLDIVPAMLERAQRLQAEQHLENVTWKLGSSTELPLPSGRFDCVVTRFSFHHFLDPVAALSEMRRVAKPGATVLVCDVAPEPETQAEFNRWEILRDPSHTHALTDLEFEALGSRVGLELRRRERYALIMDLDHLLAGSFPKPGDADRLRTLFDAEVRAGGNNLGVAARRAGKRIEITYPVAIFAWRKQLGR